MFWDYQMRKGKISGFDEEGFVLSSELIRSKLSFFSASDSFRGITSSFTFL